MTVEPGRRRRVAMYVYNDATLDSRVRREAATLAAAGYEVTLLATTPRGATEQTVEALDGYRIVRVPVPAEWQRHWPSVLKPGAARDRAFGAAMRAIRGGPRSWPDAGRAFLAALGWLVVAIARRVALLVPRRLGGPGEWPPSQLRWLLNWRWSTLRWAEVAATAAPAADVHHGHDLTALPAARRAAARDGAALVYDSHEIFVDSGQNATRPRWARTLLRRLERRWTRGIAALVSVNPAYADVIAKRIRPARTVVVHNCPPAWPGDPEAATRLRRVAGVPEGAPIVLYHGAFSRERGLEELGEAILEPSLAAAHLVFLGYGGERTRLDELATEARFGGRVHVVEAVPPDELLGMVAGAAVDAIPLQPTTLNHWLCTPNKLFESIAAGVPVVVSDFPVMREIVLDDPDGPLGATCDPTSPASIAAAIASVLTMGDEDAARLRERCRGAAQARWNWERESRPLLALYAELAGSDAARSSTTLAKV